MVSRLFPAVLVLVASLAGALHALEPPKSTPILTVTGDISTSNTNGAAMFDRDMLQDLEWREITTFTSYTEGPQVFSGPTLASLLEVLGVESGMLRATAVNDYTVEIPVEHAIKHNVLLAMDHNGRAMRVRDKGPIWVVYPLSETEVARRPFDGEMIWQLVRMEVVD